MKKYIVVKKTIDNPMVDMSIEHLIRFVCNEFKYKVNVTKNFIIARIPEKKGDVQGARKFFNRIHMVYAKESERPDFEVMKDAANKSFEPDVGMGNELILEALKVLMVEYDILDDPKF